MLDRLTGLQVFGRVAALGSLSAAARALAMSQTMATKHMTALEERLGVKLLHRTTRRVTLTEAGRSYLDSVERILSDIEEADAAVAAATRDVRGTLRVNAPVGFGTREIAPLVPEFLVRHPALTLDLGLNDRQVDLVDEGWDLAIRIGRITDQTLVARKLAPCHMIVCASPSYLTTHGRPRTIAELSAHNCMGYVLSSTVGVESWLFGRDKPVSVGVRGNLKGNNGDALVAAAAAGLGIVYVPTFLVARDVAAGALEPLCLDVPPIASDGIFAVYPATRRPMAKVRSFIDYLLECIGPKPHWDEGLPV